ncbi:ROK family protein [Reyranella sp. MMS21-HV4-11]|uniref:ROK family protein n=1 Tax=Reyranella humidisoli TaxID=2849149 RepID=A0ABS6IMQ7_9HYPH|nr:ROK family protein [Reyranella sp. MMS21-HV4-11]MBU8875601.1 ROK family protein [Reyranella sp. MMS21-HV4-11]
MRIGIDLGGTKIEGIVLADDGRERARLRVPTPRDSYEATLEAVAGVIRELEAQVGESCRVGVGHPGAISPATGLVKNANSTRLNGRPLDVDLKQVLDRTDIRFSNDANCFAVSEASDGAGAGAPIVFGVILGTGVGGGVVIDGRPVVGAQAVGGEWGHNALPLPRDDERPGPQCYCGRKGCVESWLSGPAFQAQYVKASGSELRATDIAEAAATGEKIASECLERYCDRLARSLANVVNLLDPHVIVLGGGLSKIPQLYDRVPELWKDYIFSERDRIATRLRPPQHGDSSGVRGAAWLWPV